MKKLPKPNTIEAKVLAYLQTGHSLDIPKAQALFGYIQLPSAMHKLRLKGHPILSTTMEGPQGNKLTFYRLPKKVRVVSQGSTPKVGHVVGLKHYSPISKLPFVADNGHAYAHNELEIVE